MVQMQPIGHFDMADTKIGSRLSASSRLPQIVEPGLRVQLQCEVENNYQSFPSRIIETESDHADLVVVWPRLSVKEHVPVRSGQLVVVELPVEHDALYGFETRVADKQPEYLDYLALLLAGELKRIQRRHYVRLPVAISPNQLIVNQSAESAALKGQIVDLSAGGVRIRLLEPLAVAQVIDLQFGLSGDAKLVNVRVEVKRVVAVEQGKRQFWDAGCGFLDIHEPDRDRIMRFIFAEQRRMAREGKR